MIIDIHTHAFPDTLAERAVSTLAEVSKIAARSDGTCDGLSASARKAGIDLSVVMPIATKPSQTRSINSWATEVNRNYENVLCFGTLHPAQSNWQEEVEYIVSNGIKGVKLHPDYQETFVDDPALIPILRGLADADLILLLHAGVDIGLPPPTHCTPDRLARMLDSVPGIKVIAAHMGGYLCWDDVEKHLLGRDLYLDTSYSLADLGGERMAGLIRTHGPDRVLFGTDSPWTDQSAELAGVRALSLAREEIDGILGGNAQRLLKLD